MLLKTNTSNLMRMVKIDAAIPILVLYLLIVFSLPSDINECAINGTHNCHQHANCFNDVGSFSCSCVNGFTGNGTFCQGELSLAIL